jgi:hypothetical protein
VEITTGRMAFWGAAAGARSVDSHADKRGAEAAATGKVLRKFLLVGKAWSVFMMVGKVVIS